ncbi:MAG: zinc transporter ZitB, partial [Bacteroidetes bacterium RIFOXYA12_FULL_33_9]
MRHSHSENEKKTGIVVIITFVVMIVEIFFGLSTKSMALLADGIHMGSHVLAIGLSWFAYFFIRKSQLNKKYNFNAEKALSLSGFTSGLLLLIFAFYIIVEAANRFLNPEEIVYLDAIYVAIIGLLVNIASAFILHHHHDHTDHNIKAAYLHVIADALTSISAIVGLLIAMIWKIEYIDTIAAILSSLVIIKWSIALLKDSGKVLLDYKNT